MQFTAPLQMYYYSPSLPLYSQQIIEMPTIMPLICIKQEYINQPLSQIDQFPIVNDRQTNSPGSLTNGDATRIQDVKQIQVKSRITKKEDESYEAPIRLYRRWTDIEHNIFINFIRDNGVLFETRTTRTRSKVFKLLVQKLKGKTESQIRSHYQSYMRTCHIPLGDKLRKQIKMEDDNEINSECFE